MAEDKIKAFAVHILQECEQEGFTISEAARLPHTLQDVIQTRIEELHRESRITAGAQVREEPAIVAGRDLPFPL